MVVSNKSARKYEFGDPVAIKLAQGAELTREWTDETLAAAKEIVERVVGDIQFEGFDVTVYDSSCAAGNNHSIEITIEPYEEWVYPKETDDDA